MKQIVTLFLSLICATTFAQLTLDSCQSMARKNFPLIKQYDLIEKSKEYNLSNAIKGYLPQITINGKASYQSAVTSVPGMPIVIPKDQYSVSAEVYQNIYDGGAIKANQKITEANTESSLKQLQSDLYALKDRVNQMYFGILLLNAQLEQNAILQNDLKENYNRVSACIQNGIANQADLDAVQVEQMQAIQTALQMQANKEAYLSMLSLMTGTLIKTATLQTPQAPHIIANEVSTINRPELELFDAQAKAANAQYDRILSNTLPKFGLFATGAYAKPGLNMFDINFAPYYIVGAKFTWNLSNFYTKSNDLNNIKINAQQVAVQKDLFLYNTQLAMSQQNSDIVRIQKQMEYDDKIIALRESVRKSAQAKVTNGTLSTIELMHQVTAENLAHQTKIQHQIELLIAQYKLNNTAGN